MFLIAGCKTTKHTIVNNAEDPVAEDTLDEIQIFSPKEKLYRAAYLIEFDLLHTKLDVFVDWSKQHLPGKAWLTLKPHFYPTDSLVLDAKGFDLKEVSLVSKDGSRKPLLFSYDSLKIKIRFSRKIYAHDTIQLYIEYTAKPNERKSGGSAAIASDKGLFFINPLGAEKNKPTQLWTQGETEANSCWFPTIDAPNQRCTGEISITCEKKYLTLSNGLLTSSVDLGNGLRKDTWTMRLPHAPYLFMIVVGEFAVVKDKWRNIAVDYYVEPEYAPYAKDIFGNTPEMLEFFSKKLGYDFPWPKYAQVVVRDYVSGAMENTSASLFGEFVMRTRRELQDNNYEDIVAHELFHQWFGDLVTCESWSNLPLNESFATYGEYLWAEHKCGKMEADKMLYQNLKSYFDEAQTKNETLIRFFYNDKEEMFDRHSYEKGGHVLHMLRKLVGDDAFFKSLEYYLKTNAFRAVEIHHLRLAFEEVTGRDLNWFFNQWFMNSGHPNITYHYIYQDDTVKVVAEQEQNTKNGYIFKLPLTVGIWDSSRTLFYDFSFEKKSDTFKIPFRGMPVLVDADVERILLCSRKDAKSLKEYVFQYKHHPNFTAKLEALQRLKEVQKDSPESRDALLNAMNDTFYFFRKFAVESCYFNGADSSYLIDKLKNMALYDRNASVRTAAIQKISRVKDPSLKAFFIQCLNDSSYAATAEALKAINSLDTSLAMELCKKFENENNLEINDAVFTVYANSNSSKYNEFFSKKFSTTKGYAKYILMYHYANYLGNMDKNIVLGGIETLKNHSLIGDTRLLLSAGKGALRRIVKQFEEKKKQVVSDSSSSTASDYETIIYAASEALNALNKKNNEEKRN